MFPHSVSENILFLICGLGILQGILLAILIYFHPRSDKSVNLFLALFIFFVSSVMTLPIFMALFGWQNSYIWLSFPLLPGPFLYFYLRSFKESISFKKIWPHLLPFFIFTLLAYWNITILSKRYPNPDRPPIETLSSWQTIFLQSAKLVQMILYYFLARSTLKSYQRSIRQLFSETSEIDLNWARLLVNGYLVLILAFPVFFPLMLTFPRHFNLWLLINMSIATPYIYLATFKGILQPTIWQNKPNLDEVTVKNEMVEAETLERQTPETEDSKTAKPGLGKEKMEDINRRIISLMENEKIYQEPELTLQQLAERLQCPNYQVSQSINDGLKKNFYDLINGYRVEEAKRLLLSPHNRNFTILSVGFEAGFNSKTTFNTVFKKFTGYTPTDFRERQRLPMMAG